MKQCITCSTPKPEDCFHLHRRGGTRRRGECKACTAERARKRNEAIRNGTYVPVKEPIPLTGELRLCVKCEEEHDSSKFDKDPHRADGLHMHCKGCRAEANKNYILGEVGSHA